MSFHGTSMIFDGIACEEMGLVLYDFDNHKQEATKFSSSLSISEDRIDGRYRSLFYGGTVNEPLAFKMVLCASEDRAFNGEPFDRWDLQKISSWLTGHTTYKWLTIVQPDLEDVRFRCICSELETIEIAGNKWGFSCKVTCDAPYAYKLPQTYQWTVADGKPVADMVMSESTHNGFYYPKLIIRHSGGNNGTIDLNISNAIETSSFTFKNVPMQSDTYVIDCENGVINTLSGANAYQYLEFTDSFHFPRFARGSNRVYMSTPGTFEFTCEWPVNVGG